MISEIAYYATIRHKETLSEVLEHFWKEVERHSTEPLDMEEAYDKAVGALGKERKKQGYKMQTKISYSLYILETVNWIGFSTVRDAIERRYQLFLTLS